MRIDVAAVRADCDEAVRMLQPQVPGARRPHRHAAQHDAVAVNGVLARDRCDRLEHVGLAGPAIAVLDPAQGVKLEIVVIWDSGIGACLITADEAQFAHA